MSATAAAAALPAFDPELDRFMREADRSTLHVAPPLSPVSWTRTHYRLSSETTSAEGPWEPTPYQADLLDVACMDGGPEEMFCQKSARIGYTSALLAMVAYMMGHLRRHVSIYMPNDNDARLFVKDSIDPMIRDSPPLAQMVSDMTDRRRGDTAWLKMLGGKALRIAGAVSPSRFRRVTADFVALDELDGYPSEIGNEGDPVTLAGRAVRNSPFSRLMAGSTPTEASTSMICREMNTCSIVFEFAVACPNCGAWEVMRWPNMRWDEGGHSAREIERRSASVRYVSSCCGHAWGQDALSDALQGGVWMSPKGEWILTTDDEPPKLMDSRWNPVGWPRRVGFRIWAGYSVWYPWTTMVHDWLSSQEDVLKLKAFTNLTLGEPWKDQEITLDENELARNRENLSVLPQRVKAVYASVDVQQGWLSCMVVGYGPGEESWIVERREFHGGNDKLDSPAWTDFHEWVRSTPTWDRLNEETGEIERKSLDGVVLDSAYNTDTVYRSCFRVPHRRRIVVKGMAGWQHPIVKLPVSRAKSVDGSQPLFIVGVDQAKLLVAQRLMKGRVHFADTLPEEVYPELTAERLVRLRSSGRWVLRWKQDRERNEAFDCFDAETEVLTEHGWAHFRDLSEQALLATVNLDSDELEFQRPLALIDKPYDGEMVGIASRRVDIRVTPTHRMVVVRNRPRNGGWQYDSPEIVQAKDLRRSMALKAEIGGWRGCDDALGALLPSANPTDIAELLGWYAAEGSRWSPNGSYRVAISQSRIHNEANCRRIEELLDRLPWAWRYDVHTISYMVTRREAYELVGLIGDGAANKRVPECVMQASRGSIKAFVDAAIAGDGWTTKDGHRIYSTTSRALADGMQALFVRLGRMANIAEREPGTWNIRGQSGVTKRQYHVSECRTRTISLDGQKDGKRGFLPERIEAADRRVYCASVPNGTLVCRRKGKTFIAGNCLYMSLVLLRLHNPVWLTGSAGGDKIEESREAEEAEAGEAQEVKQPEPSNPLIEARDNRRRKKRQQRMRRGIMRR